MSPRLLRPRAAGGFDPRSISGLRLWFDGADRSTMFDADTGGSLVADGAAVGRWQDKSGFGNHATQSTANNRPAVTANAYSGRSALSFDGSNDSLLSSFNPSTSLGSSFTFVVVLNRTSGGGTFPVVFGTDLGGTSAGRALFLLGTDNYKISYGQNGSDVNGTQAATAGTKFGAIITNSNSSVEIRVNNAAAGSGTPASTGAITGTTFGIGQGGGGTYFNGTIYEAMLFTRAITSTEVSTLFTAHLTPKWGL